MKKSRFAACVLSLAVVGAVLSGCSGKNGGSTEQKTPDTTAGTAAQESGNKETDKMEAAASEAKEKGSGQKIVLRFADQPSENDEMIMAVKKMAELVQERTNGEIEIQVYPGGQLGSNNDVMQGVKMGAIDFGRMQMPFLADAGNNPVLRITSLPYLFKDYETELEVLQGEIGDELLQSITDSQAGVVGLTYFVPTSRNVFTVSKKVATLDDLKGLKIRVQNNELYIDMFNALGASPTPISTSEVYSALQTGVVDGAENPIKGYYNDKFYEVAKYCSLSPNDSSEPSAIFVSKLTWDKLSSEQQGIVKQAAREAAEYFHEETRKRMDEYMVELEKAGVEFIEIQDIENWEKAVESLYEKYGTEYMDLIQRIRDFK